jgi:hypothetical protein
VAPASRRRFSAAFPLRKPAGKMPAPQKSKPQKKSAPRFFVAGRSGHHRKETDEWVALIGYSARNRVVPLRFTRSSTLSPALWIASWNWATFFTG